MPPFNIPVPDGGNQRLEIRQRFADGKFGKAMIVGAGTSVHVNPDLRTMSFTDVHGQGVFMQYGANDSVHAKTYNITDLSPEPAE